LKEIDAIVKDSTAGSVKLKQAEEEIRNIIAELASELYLKKKRARKRPHNLNSTRVRKMLVECGVGKSGSNLPDGSLVQRASVHFSFLLWRISSALRLKTEDTFLSRDNKLRSLSWRWDTKVMDTERGVLGLETRANIIG